MYVTCTSSRSRRERRRASNRCMIGSARKSFSEKAVEVEDGGLGAADMTIEKGRPEFGSEAIRLLDASFEKCNDEVGRTAGVKRHSPHPAPSPCISIEVLPCCSVSAEHLIAHLPSDSVANFWRDAKCQVGLERRQGKRSAAVRAASPAQERCRSAKAVLPHTDDMLLARCCE